MVVHKKGVVHKKAHTHNVNLCEAAICIFCQKDIAEDMIACLHVSMHLWIFTLHYVFFYKSSALSMSNWCVMQKVETLFNGFCLCNNTLDDNSNVSSTWLYHKLITIWRKSKISLGWHNISYSFFSYMWKLYVGGH